jgi:hypothetical protein
MRYRDSKTGTESGPDNRTGNAGTVLLSGGNSAIQVTPVSIPSRATHWQVQMVLSSTGDAPANFIIHLTALDAVGGSTISDGAGWIPVASTTAFFDADPLATGTQFEFRTVGVVVAYRHSNIPTLATSIAHFNGRSFWASDSGTWLVWSEADNPEHFYNDPTDPSSGFNTVDGTSLVDTVISPNMALAATESAILFFTRTGISLGEGSFILSGTSPNQIRDARFTILGQDSVGAVSPNVQVVDQEVYFFAQDGPKVFSGGGVLDLDPEAIRAIWDCRDPLYEHRSHIGYLPDQKLVTFSFVSKNTPITGYPDVTICWHTTKRQWCPPWTLFTSAWTLHRDQTGGSNRGLKAFMGLPYGSVAEFGFGDGDGADPSGTDFDETNSSSDTGTTVDNTGAGWTADEFVDHGLWLKDRTTGRMYYKIIKTNDTDTLTWEGSLADAGAGWTFAIAGFPYEWHGVIVGQGEEVILNRLIIQNRDVMGTEV